MHDPRVLRAIAHPVRNRILGELHAAGALRAADIARELGIPANQASFHLRQLAKYGVIEEAVAEGRDRRDRVWRPVAERGLRIDLRDLAEVPGGPAAVGVWRRQAADWAHQVVDAAYSDRVDGRDQVSITESALRLTDEEAREFATELTEVLDRWSQRTRDQEGTRRTFLLLQLLQPYPEPPPAPDDATG
ncbi:helix-turn-helix domain-containing protein [Modestobacter sp. I12A-02628]|uniref:Helix-turn-helix transcriptional regulator n=1 Tax=Goekera deserti TaxID=2497753 RepID=A0A7K3WJE9_9ACTN|nr:helix-turn-helix domain-containing protein [Goekera deserti]NDI48428.1 helix-turn-helix domain-containing protein [Goekera deserti]NEL56029.1 helix-turn-helix transcriptional regulator [Goekera deserti]